LLKHEARCNRKNLEQTIRIAVGLTNFRLNICHLNGQFPFGGASNNSPQNIDGFHGRLTRPIQHCLDPPIHIDKPRIPHQTESNMQEDSELAEELLENIAEEDEDNVKEEDLWRYFNSARYNYIDPEKVRSGWMLHFPRPWDPPMMKKICDEESQTFPLPKWNEENFYEPQNHYLNDGYKYETDSEDEVDTFASIKPLA
jgi:hypothetical protein